MYIIMDGQHIAENLYFFVRWNLEKSMCVYVFMYVQKHVYVFKSMCM